MLAGTLGSLAILHLQLEIREKQMYLLVSLHFIQSCIPSSGIMLYIFKVSLLPQWTQSRKSLIDMSTVSDDKEVIQCRLFNQVTLGCVKVSDNTNKDTVSNDQVFFFWRETPQEVPHSKNECPPLSLQTSYVLVSSAPHSCTLRVRTPVKVIHIWFTFQRSLNLSSEMLWWTPVTFWIVIKRAS